MFQKNKRVKLKGEKLQQLNQDIFDRDNSRCVVCGHFVSSEEKFHHEPCGTKKSDEVGKGVVLCMECHFERHFGKSCLEIKRKVLSYLRNLYEVVHNEV